MKKFCALFLISQGFFAFCEEGSICDFEFSGLKRTKESYLLRVLEEFLGEDCGGETLDKIETKLREQGLFSEIKIEIYNGENPEKIVKIELKEKISFLPLPFASYTNGGAMGGIVVMDNNAFGRRDSFMAGGFFSKSLQTALSAFSKPATDFRHPGFSLFANFAQKKYEISNIDGEVLQKIGAKKFSFSAAIVQKISARSQISLGARYGGAFFDDLADSHQVVFSPTFRWKKSDWNGFFLLESALEAGAQLGFYAPSEFVAGERFGATFQKAVLPRLRFSAESFLCACQNKKKIDQMTRSDAKCNILPQDFYTPRLFSANFALECAVLKAKMGVLSLYAAHQMAFCDDFDEKSDFSCGFGAGILAYLAKINVPSLSFGIYYNIQHNSIQFGASFGAGF